MIIHPVTKENLLSLGMQNSCALIGAAFLVVCVSGGWLKYLSFPGTVTAGVVGAGLLSVAIENHRRNKVADAKVFARINLFDPSLTPLDIERPLGPHGELREFYIDGDRAILTFQYGGPGREVSPLSKDMQSRDEGTAFGRKGYIAVSRAENGGRSIMRYSWGQKVCDWEIRVTDQFIGFFAYEEITDRLHILVHRFDGELIKEIYTFTRGSNEPTVQSANGCHAIYCAKGGLCWLRLAGTRESPQWSVWYQDKEHVLPLEDLDTNKVKVIDEKMYYLSRENLYVLDLKTGQVKVLLENSFIEAFDIQGDLLTYHGSGRICICNLVTQETRQLKEHDWSASLSLKFCGEDTIARLSYERSNAIYKATWTTFKKAEGSAL